MRKVLLFTGIMMVLFAYEPVFAEPPTGINLGHDYTFQLVTGNLTSSGVQYSTMDTTAVIAAELTLFTKSIDLIFGNERDRTASHKFLIDLYFEIHMEVSSISTGTADVEWKPQARNAGGTWTDLASYVDVPNVGTVLTASTLKGYATISSTLDEIPFDFRILIKCDETDEGRGRLKSGSYVRATFRDITWGQ